MPAPYTLPSSVVVSLGAQMRKPTLKVWGVGEDVIAYVGGATNRVIDDVWSVEPPNGSGWDFAPPLRFSCPAEARAARDAAIWALDMLDRAVRGGEHA